MTQKAKASQSAVRSVTQVVLFGLDESGKPKAARFSEPQASIATKAAAQLKLRVLAVTNETIAELAAKLPSGRLHANGKGFIPAVRRDLYSKLLEASGQAPDPSPPPDSGGAGGVAAAKATGKHPPNWQAIAAGHIVIIQDDDPKDGWWEAIVVGTTADMLSLRWRAAQHSRRTMLKHRLSVGLMFPDHPSPTENQARPARTNGHKKAIDSTPVQQDKSPYSQSWDELGPDKLVLAQEDGPLGQWWEAIIVSRQDDTFMLRWRDYVDLPTIVRPRQQLALLHPADKKASATNAH